MESGTACRTVAQTVCLLCRRLAACAVLPIQNLSVTPRAMNVGDKNPGLQRVKFQLRASGIPENPPNPKRSGIHSRGYLPHVKREGASYFVTFRLTDSLPKDVLLRFEREHEEVLRHLPANATAARAEEIHRELRRKVERYLDRGIGECHLRRPEIAQLVAEALRHFHEQHYVLDDWVVMPNHVHVILWPMPNRTLSDILRSRKGHTAREANLLLGRTGETFWQRESFDHWIRNDDEKSRIRRYIRMNPVNARLCKAPEDWKWSSAWPGWNTASQTARS
jgi:type I restriction enzyme R subunit/putative DNA methylase